MDIGSATPGERVCLVGLLEGCDAVSEVSDLATFHRRGVRVVGLTWNPRNRWGAGCEAEGGLTPDGLALVREADRLGMAHDVSHLSRKSVDDLLAAAKGPVIASHVGAASVHAHHRNLTDAHLRAVAQRGGVVALVLYEKFLTGGKATFDDAMRHLRHMLEVCGASGGDPHRRRPAEVRRGAPEGRPPRGRRREGLRWQSPARAHDRDDVALGDLMRCPLPPGARARRTRFPIQVRSLRPEPAARVGCLTSAE
jgi:hypothetical protein